MKREFVRRRKLTTHMNMHHRPGHYRWQSSEYYGRISPYKEAS